MKSTICNPEISEIKFSNLGRYWEIYFRYFPDPGGKFPNPGVHLGNIGLRKHFNKTDPYGLRSENCFQISNHVLDDSERNSMSWKAIAECKIRAFTTMVVGATSVDCTKHFLQ
jgi:hypothetical protein